MNNFKKLAVAVGATLLGSSIALHANAWSFFKYKPAPTNDKTITEIVASSGNGFDRRGYDYDILLAAVTAADLADTLSTPGLDVSLLAPNDYAFIKLARDFGYQGRSESGAFDAIFNTLVAVSGSEANAIATLTNILLYHVLPSEKTKLKIVFGGEQTTLLEGASILPVGRTLVDNDPEFLNPKLNFWKKGRKASNGIVHAINRVLIPVDLAAAGQGELPTITDVVVASGGDFDDNTGDFDILLNAILAADSLAGSGLASLLGGDGQFTVFAPTDAAFIRLVNDLGIATSDEAEAFDAIAANLPGLTGLSLGDALTLVLTYHVNAGDAALTLKDVLTSDTVETAANITIEPNGISLVDQDPDLSNPTLLVRQGNILTSNGRIHPITRVLIPADL
jgi:uncharacterized surface protein with fasciclin (FAS1) repeats